MSSGIYAYWDNVKNYYVYIGKDSNIDKKIRHKEHIKKCNYNKQPINRIVQNNPERYEYRIIMNGNYNEWQLNKMEKLCIKSFQTYKHDYPNKNVFNFTIGGDGVLGHKHTPETRKKISKSRKGNIHSEEARKKMSEATKGNKHPQAKYTIWNINTTKYDKNAIFKNNGGDEPRKAFKLKYKRKNINIGGFIDFTTPEIIHDLICEAIEDYNE